MRKLFLKTLLALLLVTPFVQISAQTNVYTVTSGELLFQWADIKFTQAYMDANPNDQQVENPLRFTAWFHIGQYVHFDFTNNLGLYTGLASRNVGMISDENLEITQSDGTVNTEPFKIIRRTYNLGIPLALKLGSFNNHLYIFGGGEMELAYAYKEKYWNSHSRSGAKTKDTEWFGSQTPTFIPSVFLGVQMPGGVNVKFKYYLDNFLNNDYTNKNKVSDLTRYEQSQMMYVSVSWQFKTREVKKTFEKEDRMTSL